MIIKSNWNKRHIIEGIKKVCENQEMVKNARSLDAYEFGVYRGEATQLIDNTFYAYQFPIKNIYGFDSFEGLPQEDTSVERFYLFNKGMFADVGNKLSPLRPNGIYIKSWFNELTKEHVEKFNMKPAAFVHVDGDLYISCVQSLTFMFENSLIVSGTILGFDEYKSTSTIESGGESKAFQEICDKYKVEAQEFFRNVYFDRLECWQNCIEIKSIGEQSDLRLINESE